MSTTLQNDSVWSHLAFAGADHPRSDVVLLQASRHVARRRFGSMLQGSYLKNGLRKAFVNSETPTSSLDKAIDEDSSLSERVAAAESLIFEAPNNLRGYAALLLHLRDVPIEVFRPALSAAWGHDHRYVWQAARYRNRLQAMFRHAAYPLPAALPDEFRIWRGCSNGLSLAKASRGLSWTRNRSVACWFATTYFKARGEPIVISATVRRSDVAALFDDRSEDEIVTFKPRGAQVDGAAEEWRITGSELQKTRNPNALRLAGQGPDP